MAIGHVRSSTIGSSNIGNAQPLVVEDATREKLPVAHNGQLTNTKRLREEFRQTIDIPYHLQIQK